MRLNIRPSLLVPLLILSAAAATMFFSSSKSQITPEQCAQTGFPVMFIDTMAGKKIGRHSYTAARYELDGHSGGCSVRGRGNTTWQTRELYKKPYLLRLEEEAPLLGMNSARKWVLIANTADKSFLRNSYCIMRLGRIWSRMKRIPQGRPLSLFLNGKYNGSYLLFEKIEIAPGRMSLPGEGSFLATVNSRLNKEWNFITARGIKISIRMEGRTESEYKAMEKAVQNAEDILFSGGFTDAGTGWRSVLDEDSFIDWYLANEFPKNHDAKFQASCWFLYDSVQQKIFMGPPWDFDISCGNIRWDGCENPEGLYVGTDKWYGRLFEDESFVRNVRARWKETRAEVSASFLWIQEEADALRPLVELNDSVWRSIGRRQWPHAPGWKQRKTYQSEVDYMLDFLQKRAQWLDEEFS